MQFSTLTLTLLTILATTALAAPSPNPNPNPAPIALPEDTTTELDTSISDAPIEPYFEGGWEDGPPPAADKEKRDEKRAALLEARGFGCPGDEEKCHRHCRSVGGGRRGGYCGGQLFLHLTCICYR